MSGGWSAEALVARHALDAGAELAITDGDSTLTWAELDARCDAVAADLGAAGVRAGAVVAVPGEASVAAVATILGVLRAGAVAAPVPAGLTTPERAAALDVLAPAHVIGDSDGGGGGPGRPGRALAEAGVIVLTSGTTGRPKGVILSSRALAASADAWIAVLPPATGWLLALGLSHVAGLGVVWRAIAAQVPVRIAPGGDPAALRAGLDAPPPVSHASLVPAQLVRLLEAAGDGPPPATLRAVPLGGGTIAPSLVTRALDAGWPVVPTYGLSEAGSGVTALSSEEARLAPGSAGRPLPGVRVTIEEPDTDGVGEIIVTTAAGFSGYAGKPARAPNEPIRTGDLGRLDAEGRLHVIDRRTDRIVRGGENIATAEVEAVLLAHAAIAEAAVVARPDRVWGQVPVAAIVLRDGAQDPRDESLATYCRRSLAGFKVPAAFLRLDALPRAGGGKVRRAAVRALLAGEPSGILARPDGDAVGWRVTGTGPASLVLLPGTLSNAAQLDRLAAAIAAPGDVTVHAIDRRGTGTGRLADPRPLDVVLHLEDLVAYLDARGIHRAAVVGVSFGGVLALELAARHPGRVTAVVAYEPPYGAVADARTVAWFRALAADTAEAHRNSGASAAAETFLRAVAGDAAWERLHDRARAFLAREGDGALADAGLTGLRPEDLAAIKAPVTILTGGASEPLYAPIADALAARVPGARRGTLDGLAHPAPITDPAPVAAAIRAALATAGLVTAPEPGP
jgi:O-succinylbenzoic acid--CoA ligase